MNRNHDIGALGIAIDFARWQFDGKVELEKQVRELERDRARLDYLQRVCTVCDGDHTSGLIETMDGPAISWGSMAAVNDLRAAVDAAMGRSGSTLDAGAVEGETEG